MREYRHTPRAWRSDTEAASLTGLMIGASPRGLGQLGILGILEADSLSSSSTADIPPSQPVVHPRRLQAGDLTVPDIQEQVRAPELQVPRQAEVLASRGHPYPDVLIVGDSTLGSVTVPQVPVSLAAIRVM